MSVDLIYHASKGHLSNVRRLLERGILPDATSSTGETALFHAALAGHLNVVVDLLKYGADPNRCSVNGLSPVNGACVRDNVKSLAALLYHGGRLEHPTLIESATETACRCRSRRAQKYIQNVQNVTMKNFTGDFVDVHEEDKEEDESIHDEFQPGSGSYIPITDDDQLTTLQEGMRFTFIAPRVTFSNACWHRIAVSVKTSRYKEDMDKDLEMLCKLRHPRVVMILAGVISNTGLTSLVLDYFKLGNLHHVMYVSKLNLNLVQRINILRDISKAIGYIHKKNILHCYINSYSVLVDRNFRAKIGNFEHAQKIDDESLEGASINHISEQHAWMAPCELNGEPAHKSSDVYSFGALMWECLATKKPWSWLTGKNIYQAVCEECLRLPMLQDWPSTIKQILTECIGPEQERADFGTITQELEVLQTSDLEVPEEILESALEFWLTGNRKVKQRRKSASGVRKASTIFRDLSALRMDSDSDDEEEDDAKIRLLTSRRKLSSVGLSERRNTIHQGLINVVHAFQHTNKKDLRKQRDTDKYGLEVAEQLATVRSLWKTGKHHDRHRWAKEMFIRRKLEGDIKRIKMKRRFKEKCSDLKAKQSPQAQRVRRLSHGAESIARLQTIACKYEKWNWAKYTTGHEYHPPEDKYELVEEDYDEEETVIARDVLKGQESSGVHLPPLAAVNIVDLDDEDEQLKGSIEERFSDEDNVGGLIAEDSEGVGTFEHLHEKHVEGQESNVHGIKVAMKQGRQDGDEEVNEEGDINEIVEGDVDKLIEDGEGKAGEVDGEELENNQDEGEKRDQDCKEEGEDEDMDNKVDDSVQDNKHCTNKNLEYKLDVRLADRSHETRHQNNFKLVQAENYKSQNLDTNSSEASNQERNAKRSSSESFLTKSISRQTSRTSEDGGSKDGRVSFSTDAVNILDEFSQWLDDYCEDIPSLSDVGDEDLKDINDVLEGNESSREVTPENENQQSASKETLVEELERTGANGSDRTDDLPITAVDMPLPGHNDESESVQPGTSGIEFSKNT